MGTDAGRQKSEVCSVLFIYYEQVEKCSLYIRNSDQNVHPHR